MALSTNQLRFVNSYRKHLRQAYIDHPDEYMISVPVDTVTDRMIATIARYGYNKDGRVFKATCKELGIPHTYKAIKEYWDAS